MKLNSVQFCKALLLVLFSGMLIPKENYAQSPCPNDNNYWNTSFFPPPCGQTVDSMRLGVGTFGEIFVETGVTYVISTCGSGFDTKITGYIAGTGTDVFDNDDNGPACNGIEASVEWTATFDGLLWVLLDTWDCDPCTAPDSILPTDCPAMGSALLSYRQKDNLAFTTPDSMCSGETLTLVGSSTEGVFSGAGVSGGVFTAPNNNDTYTITYQLGECAVTNDITVSKSPTVTISGDNEYCKGGSAMLTANATAGSGFITTYQWKLNGSHAGTGQTFNASQAGDYTAKVFNTNECFAESAVHTVTETPGPTITIMVDSNITCTSTGGVTASVSGGVPPYLFAWSSGQNTATITGLQTAGIYTVTVTSSNGCASTNFAEVIDNCADTSCVTQNITIDVGWNMISSYVDPDTPNMLDIFSDIASDIIIVKNVQGNSTIPSFGINTIGDWVVDEGYKVKASISTTLSISCDQVDPTTTPIYLPTGWSIISYLRDTPMDAATALSSLGASCVAIVKNIDGDSYIPSFGINSIGDLLPGQGYAIKMSCPDTLIYPANLKMSSSNFYSECLQPSYYKSATNTGHNATIIIPAEVINGLEQGDEIGVFNDKEVLTGAAVYEGRNLALTVWGDDPTTEQFENMKSGEEFNVKIWRANQQKELAAEAKYEDDNKYYHNDGVSIMKRLTVDQSLAKGKILVQCFPNPTNGLITFRFNMADKALATLSIYNTVGKAITDPPLNIRGANKEIGYDASQLPSGLYFYKASVNGQLFNGSFVVDE